MAEHSIGKTIAELRKTKGWTQVELAERLNVSDKTISKWESEAGYPEITMFPRLADLFGVSIDYLMTGKEVQPEIITMSKAELCAKNDDVTLLKDIDFTQKDENNKCLIDYIQQYESLKVFSALCTTDDRAKGSFDLLTFLKFCLLSNHLELLNKKGFWLKPQICSYRFDSAEDIMGLMPIGALEHFGQRQGKDQYACILPDDFFTMIASDKRINENTINFLLGKQRGRKCVWYHAFPYLIDACYEVGNTNLLRRLLTLSEENNQYAYDNLNDKSNYAFNYFFIGFKYSNNGHGLVRILDKTLNSALQKNDFEMIDRMNALNRNVMKYWGFKCGIVSDDEIRVAKLKLDKSVSAQDIIIQSSIHNGIVVIDELLAVNDADLIEKTLEKYPVSKYELKYTVLEEMREALKKVNLWGFLQAQQGIGTPIQERGSNFSGGQCQRLAIARALLHDTPVYIFDEATSNIDAESEEMIMDVIHKLAETKTIILISHRLANVVKSDRIYMMKEGCVTETGTHEELMEQNGDYANLYRSQMELEQYGKEAVS